MSIRITGLSKEFQKSRRVLDIRDISLPTNDITVIIGKNGSGKSTLLNCIGGLLAFEKGSIEVTVPAADSVPPIRYTLHHGIRIGPPRDQRRRIGYIFQQKVLWNHLSVIGNIIHPLTKVHKITRKDALDQARRGLSLLGISDSFHNCYPGQLSGGQQRKVAIARTLAIKPDLLLIDELEANLDQASVKLVMGIIKDHFIDDNKTVLMVSHSTDLLEQFNPHILVLHEGRDIVCTKGATELLTKDYEMKERGKLIKDSVDPSSSRWFLAQQSLATAIRLSEINLAEKDIDILFVEMGKELSKLISQFEPDAEHLLLIATQIKAKSTGLANEVKIRCAEQSQGFVLDGMEASKLEPLVTKRSVEKGTLSFEFVKDHRSLFETGGGFNLIKKAEAHNNSLIDVMFDTNGEKLEYQCTDRHPTIKGAYNISIPIPLGRVTEHLSYYEFSTKTRNVYLIGCTISDEVKGIISIDTTAEKKWSNFLIQQLILIGNMVAIAIKNHEEISQ